jgi:hypothetical protein
MLKRAGSIAVSTAEATGTFTPFTLRLAVQAKTDRSAIATLLGLRIGNFFIGVFRQP